MLGAEKVRLVEVKGEYQEVLLRACTDSTDVRLAYSKTGSPAAFPPEKKRFVRHVTVWFYEDAWHVVQE